jgi:hypothetical protein
MVESVCLEQDGGCLDMMNSDRYWLVMGRRHGVDDAGTMYDCLTDLVHHRRRRWQGNCIAYNLSRFCIRPPDALKTPQIIANKIIILAVVPSEYTFPLDAVSKNAVQCYVTLRLIFVSYYSSYSASRTPQKSEPKHASTAYQALQYKLAVLKSKLPSSLRGT